LTRLSPTAKTLALPLALSVLSTAVALLALLGAPYGTRQIAIPVFLAGAGTTFGVGLSDLARGRNLRFARVLIASGLLWSLSALAASPEPIPYSIGRVCQWLVELAVIFLFLTYPAGRLTEPVQRMLVVFGGLLLVVLYLPTALVAQQYPNPSPWSMCTSACARNVFALGSSTPGVVPDLMIPVRGVLTAALLVAVAGVAIQRARGSRAMVGRMRVPIAAIAVVQAVALTAYLPARAGSATAPELDVLSWVYVLALPAVALATIAGRLYRRLFAARALDRMAHDLRSTASPAQVGLVMATALEDPSLKILHSFPGDEGLWVDESGAPLPMPQAAANGQITEVGNGNWRLAIVHDRELAEDPTLVETAGSYALAAMENEQLSGELRSSLKELANARALGVTAERRERRKIERDIHDGAQQRLVALRVKLGLTADEIQGHDAPGADALRALEDDVDATIEEVRAFARGVYPSMLAETGLASALRTLGRGMTLPTLVIADGLGRYSREIETTVYFSCSEALQNAVKHARGATSVTIRVWDDGNLNFEVRDDGDGFDAARTPMGIGLSNLIDRLASTGGRITIQSACGQGTTISGTIPASGGELPRLPAPL
jgi:signal transduction histidine kinase